MKVKINVTRQELADGVLGNIIEIIDSEALSHENARLIAEAINKILINKEGIKSCQ